MPNIKSSTDLRNNYSAISTFCHGNKEPVLITRNGEGDLAVMSIEVYEELSRNYSISLDDSKEELYRLLAEGRAAVEAGQTRPAAEVFSDLKRRIADGTI